MTSPVEFWFEFASTYSYPTSQRIADEAKRVGRNVLWRPFLLGPIFKQQGWNDSPFNLYPAKGAYMYRDLERLCRNHDLPWRKPSSFPRNGLLAARVACAALNEPWMPEFARRVYRANFAHDENISKPDVILACLTGVAPDPEAALAAGADADAKACLRKHTERAVELGIFGAPSFLVNGELFWGDDRLAAAIAGH